MIISKQHFMQLIEDALSAEFSTDIQHADVHELHCAIGHAVLDVLYKNWAESRRRHAANKRAYYFSAEYLMGRAIYSNLFNLGILEQVKEILSDEGIDIALFEEIEDAALGNGGLGRLAACFLDSAATMDVPLDGYGIRYEYGLFKQSFEDGFQKEAADDWLRFEDPWSVRRYGERITVKFGDGEVAAVPYDTPVIGYGTDNVGTLRLWQCEPLEAFDFTLFNEQKYDEAVKAKNDANNISRVLYPNDDTPEGKKLRLKQQYFFCSASLQDILRNHIARYGEDFSHFAELYAIQLNDTHPVISIPELIRLLTAEHGVSFEEAFNIARQTFAYTNHTLLAEALETWDGELFRSVVPQVFEIVKLLDQHLWQFLQQKGECACRRDQYAILAGGYVHMARMAIYCTHATNGVAKIHTALLTGRELRHWAELFPDRFQNKTNGITQRRWLGLANPGLSSLIRELTGSDAFLTDLTALKPLERYADDHQVLDRFDAIKRENKERLASYIAEHEGVRLDPSFIFDIQAKRLHEYKRQLLNAFSILDLYFRLKAGELPDFTPTAFIFGAKSAPGYFRAKGIIKYINEIAKKLNADPDTNDKLTVVFVQNYNVSYAEKLMTAADVSEQISTAGKEASGTGNMKFMLNATVTLGTYDGANIEIVEAAGEENNYIFGARVETLEQIEKSYDPAAIYRSNPRLKRVLDTLIDGTFDDGGTGMFRELYDSLLIGASWHRPDHYFILYDFEDYQETKLRLNADYKDRYGFLKKCWLNMCNSYPFSSDRTIREYADQIWKV